MIDAKLAALLKEADLGEEAVWLHKQSGKHIMLHWACERLGAKKGVVFDQPVVVQADAAGGTAVVLVTGRLGDKSEWSFGEASPANNKAAYPFSMAEKRGKDRVVLKLVGLHGEVYSEEEAEDFKPTIAPRASDKWHGPLGITELKGQMRYFAGELAACEAYDDLLVLLEGYKAVLEQCARDLPTWYNGDGKDIDGVLVTIKARREVLAGESRV